MKLSILTNLFFSTMVCILISPKVIAQESIVVTVDTSTVLRTNNRHLMGQNLAFVEKVYGTWDSDIEEFENTFWQPFKETAPGMIRFPGGEWSYGYHFDLARKGIKHKVNEVEPNQDFRPQHFLRLIKDLNRLGVETTPLIHPSAQFTSPEEASAWVAYMIAPSDDNCQNIGADSWDRKYLGLTLQWHDTCYWGTQRELDNARDPSPYTGTLYFQLGNEEWKNQCNNCQGYTDSYGTTSEIAAMTIQKEEGVPPPVHAYWPRYQAMWAKLRGPAGLFTADQVQVGAIGYTGIFKPQGQEDRFIRNTKDHWNKVLLTNIRHDSNIDLDFLTLHTYMYSKSGWEKHSAMERHHNLLASHDHLQARIQQIRQQVSPPLDKPIYITEYNTHITKSNNIPVIQPSSLLDALHMVNWTVEAMNNETIDGLLRWISVVKPEKADHHGGGFSMFVSDKKSLDIWKMSSYYAAKLLAELYPTVVDVTIAPHTGFKPKGFTSSSWTWWQGYNTNTKTGPEIPFLTASATLSPDGKELALLMLNRNTVDGFSVSLNIDSVKPGSEYTRIELDSVDDLDEGHDDLFDFNSYGTNAIEQIKLQKSLGVFQGVIDIGPHQAVVIKLQLQPNQPPIADAGLDQVVNEGTQGSLQGSDSYDPDGVITRYHWEQTDGPAVVINNSKKAEAWFDAPEVTEETQFLFSLTVADNDGAEDSAVTAVIVRDTTPKPPTVMLTANDAEASESGLDEGMLTFSRTGDTSSTLTIRYTVSGSATPGLDYVAKSGVVRIKSGQLSRTVKVIPKDDTEVEGDETVVLTLLANATYQIGTPNKATVTITSDDVNKSLPVVTISKLRDAQEAGRKHGRIRFNRSGRTARGLTLYYSVGGSATSGVDFKVLSGNKRMKSRRRSSRLDIVPKNDKVVEGNETIVITLLPNEAYRIGKAHAVTVNIIDND